jgi:hypothetical protein
MLSVIYVVFRLTLATLSVVILSVIILSFCAECHYTKYMHTDCH